MTNTDKISTTELDEMTQYLFGFLTEERAQTLLRTVSYRTDYMRIMTENMFHPQNASALVRHCEAFGVQHIHTVQTLCDFSPNVDIVRGSDKWIDIHREASTTAALDSLKSAGYRIVATTPHHEDSTPETFDVKKSPFVLVFGTEHAGISDEVQQRADEFLRIPMCGMVESLNVSASAAILIYILSQKIRTEVDDWHLTRRQSAETLFRWAMRSVRDSERILRKKFEL